MEMSWAYGFLGGLMIGGAATLYLLVNGRIMGASSIVGQLVDGTGWSTAAERISFLAALVLVPWGLSALSGGATTHLTSNWAVIIAAGVLVGLGTRLANGCTSGHGVCGISRLSMRGIVATVFYVLAGGLMMALFRHGFGVI